MTLSNSYLGQGRKNKFRKISKFLIDIWAMRSNITHGHSWVNYYDILREDRDYNNLQNSDQQIKKTVYLNI